MNAYGLLPVHPRTGLRAVGVVGGHPVWPVLGAAEDPPTDPSPADPPKPGPTVAKPKFQSEDGETFEFPVDTPLAQMNETERTEYWRHKAQKHEKTVKARSDYDDLKAKAKERDDLVAANATEQERAVAAAKAEGRSEAMRAAGPRLVEAHFMAAAAGRLDEERVKAILEPLNADHFLTDSGDVDTAKVTTYVNGIAPVMGTGKPPAVGPSSRGQGQRNSSASPSVASGRDRYAQRHPHRSPA